MNKAIALFFAFLLASATLAEDQLAKDLKKKEINLGEHKIDPFKPTACYDPKNFPPSEINRIRNELPGEIQAASRKLESVERKFITAKASDEFFLERVARRMEIAKRLIEYVKNEQKLNTVDSLLFARRNLEEFDLFLRYFDNELKINDVRGATKEEVWTIGDFGAKGDGVADDAPAFRKAIEKARTHSGLLKLKVPSGRYRMASRESLKRGAPMPDAVNDFSKSVPYWIDNEGYLIIAGLSNFTLEGEKGTVFVFDNFEELFKNIEQIRGVAVLACRNVTVRNIEIVYSKHLHSQSTIETVDPKENTITVKLDQGFPAPRIADYCCQTHLPDGSIVPHASGKFLSKVEQLENDRYKLHIKRSFQPTLTFGLEPGQKFIIPFRDSRTTPFTVMNSAFCTVENVKLHNAPAAGFSLNLSDACNVRRCVIEPLPGSVFSTNADGLHCWANVGIGPYVSECRFVGMGDDSFNVYGRGIYLVKSSKDRLWTMGGVSPDAKVLVVSPANGIIKAELKVKEVSNTSMQGRRVCELEIAENVPENITTYDSLGINPSSPNDIRAAHIGAKAYGLEPDVLFELNKNGPGTVLSGNEFRDNRNNGIVMQSSHSIIENNRIANLSMAIRVGAFLTWKEGPPPCNVLIRNNTIERSSDAINCGYQQNDRRNSDCRPLRQIDLVDNLIINAGVALDNIEGLTITGNRFENLSQKVAFRLYNVGGVTMTNNTVDNQPLADTSFSKTTKTDAITFTLQKGKGN